VRWLRGRRHLSGNDASAARPAPGRGVAVGGTAGRPGRAVPREVLRQVRLIELRTRGLVNTIFGGEYLSVFKGQGMEFAEVREYDAGDDVRSIDWNVTARMAHPYVKKYVEERELTLLLAVDLSGSEQFGTRRRFKAELAAELAAVLALSAVRNNDRVGLLIFTDRIEHFVPPRKGRRHVLRIIRDVLAFQPVGRGTHVSGALDYAARVLGHRSIVFVLSDFQLGNDDAFERSVRIASGRHDVVAIRIADAAEDALPTAGLLVLVDPETGDEVVVDTASEKLRSGFQQRIGADRDTQRRIFRRLGIDEIDVRTDGSYVEPLLAFFRRRERRLRR
jgi:uncharacterized protein (DUF58 family)